VTDADLPDIDERAEPRPGHGGPFVPEQFEVPPAPSNDRFWLEPLGPQHNEADYAAWSSSMQHIHATPGFEESRWPHPMTMEENLGDLLMHAQHFEQRLGFTYTVRSGAGGAQAAQSDVIGCLYIYPSDDATVDARVRSWVRVSHAELDGELAAVVQQWLDDAWPFSTVRYR